MYMIELGLLKLVCLSINNANKKWIIAPINNKITFEIFATTQLLFIFIFKKWAWTTMIICVSQVHVAPPTYYFGDVTSKFGICESFKYWFHCLIKVWRFMIKFMFWILMFWSYFFFSIVSRCFIISIT